ncbi:MAG: hypothetical protein PGN26_02745 [Xylophilus ampelinus]
MACTQIGTYEGDPKNLVAYVLEVDPDGKCEACRVGANSPGAVADHEKLMRFVFSPIHINKSNEKVLELDETLVNDAFDKGCSVHRMGQSEEKPRIAQLHDKGENLAAGVRGGVSGRPPQPNRTYIGAIDFIALEVRGTELSGSRGRVRIYDISQKDDCLHADVIVDCRDLDKRQKKQLKAELFARMTKNRISNSPYLAIVRA